MLSISSFIIIITTVGIHHTESHQNDHIDLQRRDEMILFHNTSKLLLTVRDTSTVRSRRNKLRNILSLFRWKIVIITAKTMKIETPISILCKLERRPTERFIRKSAVSKINIPCSIIRWTIPSSPITIIICLMKYNCYKLKYFNKVVPLWLISIIGIWLEWQKLTR